MDHRRIASLDSLRGLAALLVVFTHCAGVYAAPSWWVTHLPMSVLFWSGHGFVLVFFALSGYVLFTPFAKAMPRIDLYLVKRTARIYPPFAASILLSAALYFAVAPMNVTGLSDWFNLGSWSRTPTPLVIAGHLAMTDVRDLHSLNNVMWSLVHEMRISVAYPLIALCVRSNWRATTSGLFVVSVLSAFLNQHHPFAIAGFDPAATGSYLFLFAAGAALNLNSAAIRRWAASADRRIIVLLFAASLATIASPVDEAAITIIFGSFAALTIVGLCAAGTGDRVLLQAVPLWLGRVSYSLYLIHLIVLLTLVHLFAGRIPMLVILGSVVAISLLAAEAMYRLVELPSIELGRKLTDLLTPSGRSGKPGGRIPGDGFSDPHAPALTGQRVPR